MDIDSIAAGADFISELHKAIRQSDVLVALIGRRWLSAADMAGRRRLDDPSDYVRLELEAALSDGLRVIPTLVQGASVPTSEELPATLRPLIRRQAIELRDATFARDARRLVQRLDEIRLEIVREQRERAAQAKRDEAIARKRKREEARHPPQESGVAGHPLRGWFWDLTEPYREARARFTLLAKLVMLVTVLSPVLFTYYYTKIAPTNESRALAQDALALIPFKKKEAGEIAAKALAKRPTAEASGAVRQVAMLRGAAGGGTSRLLAFVVLEWTR
jgi:hypothetical protein